jgi:C4-dicarboxylate transporter DctQ subunit
MKILDHLEEWLITFLMAAATTIIFVRLRIAIGSGVSIPGLQDWLLGLNFRVGAGTVHHHVRLDGEVRCRLRGADRYPRRRRRADQPDDWPHARQVRGFGLLAGALFTGIVGTLGAHFVWENGFHYASIPAWAGNWVMYPKGRPRPISSGRPGSSTAPFRSVRA